MGSRSSAFYLLVVFFLSFSKLSLGTSGAQPCAWCGKGTGSLPLGGTQFTHSKQITRSIVGRKERVQQFRGT